jgi:hypothetical protein
MMVASRSLLVGNDGHAHVHDGNADLVHPGGDLHLLLHREVEPGHLLAVPERLVPEIDPLGEPGGQALLHHVIVNKLLCHGAPSSPWANHRLAALKRAAPPR